MEKREIGWTRDKSRENIVPDSELLLRPEQLYDEGLHGIEKLSWESRTVLAKALEQAQRLQHNYIGAEHVLLALLDGSHDEINQIIAELHVCKREELFASLNQSLQPGKHIQIGQVPVTSQLNNALALAIEEIATLKHKEVSPEHLLLGIAREGGGITGQVLFEHSISVEKLREVVL